MKWIVRISSLLIVLSLVITSIALIGSLTLRTTVFSSDWYLTVFSNQDYLDSLRTAIEESLAEQGRYVDVPAEVLVQGLQDRQTYVVVRKNVENAVDFLNGRNAFSLPAYPIELFHDPLKAYAQEMNAAGGMILSAEQEKLLTDIAADSAGIVQREASLLNLSIIQNARLFQSAHRALAIARSLTLPAGIAIALLLMVLMLLHRRRLRRFLQLSSISFWIAGALVSVPLIVLDRSGLMRRLSISQAHVKFAADYLLSGLVRTTLGYGLAMLVVASACLLTLFFVEERARDQERRMRNKERHRRKRMAENDPVST